MKQFGFWMPVVILLVVALLFWSVREIVPLEVVRVLMTLSIGVAGILLLRRRGATALAGVVLLVAALWISQPGVLAGKGNVEMVPASTQAIEQAAQQGKPVVLVFTADWCPFCRQLERETLTDGEVARLAKQFVVLRVDMTSSTPPEETVQLARRYGAEGLPTVAFLNAKGEWVKELTLVGYEPPRAFAQRMRHVLAQ